jgi:hypothetical protein
MVKKLNFTKARNAVLSLAKLHNELVEKRKNLLALSTHHDFNEQSEGWAEFRQACASYNGQVEHYQQLHSRLGQLLRNSGSLRQLPSREIR